MLTFAFGLTLGGFVVWLSCLSARREVVRIDEEKQLLNQEKQIVLEFMHNMVEAIGERVDRDELFQRVVHAAILSTGALSACVFAKNEEGRFSGVAVEGLFPPATPPTGKLAHEADHQGQVYRTGSEVGSLCARRGSYRFRCRDRQRSVDRGCGVRSKGNEA